MKNILPAGIIFLIIVFMVGAFAYLKPQRNFDIAGLSPTPEQSEAPVFGSRYVEYADDVLQKYADSMRVLFFYANWCVTCRPTDVLFREKHEQIPENTVVIRVNYNDTDTDSAEKALAQKYGITYQHTFVQLDSDGEVVSKWSGGQIDELIQNTK